MQNIKQIVSDQKGKETSPRRQTKHHRSSWWWSVGHSTVPHKGGVYYFPQYLHFVYWLASGVAATTNGEQRQWKSPNCKVFFLLLLLMLIRCDDARGGGSVHICCGDIFLDWFIVVNEWEKNICSWLEHSTVRVHSAVMSVFFLHFLSFSVTLFICILIRCE